MTGAAPSRQSPSDVPAWAVRLSGSLSAADPAGIAAALASGGRRYWPGSGADSPAFHARMPDRARLVEMAEMAAAGRLQFWHPWHMEVTHGPETVGRRIDWERMPNGDHEWPHALARFTHMLDLAAAHAVTGRVHFLEAYTHHLSEYLRSRDETVPFWSNKLNAALRLVNIIRSYDLIRGLPAVGPGLHGSVCRAILQEAGFLSRRLGIHVGNWEFFITTALATAAAYLSGPFATGDWEAAALARLKEVVATEILSDGTFVEQVPMYQGEVLLSLLDYLLCLRSSGLPVPGDLSAAASALLRRLEQLADPQGMVPPIGDSDRYHVGYLGGFARQVLGDGAGVGTGEGPAGPGALLHLPDAGLSRIRWDIAGSLEGYLLFDASGKPPARRAWHSHADDLQFLLHTSHGPLLTDPGRFTYASDFRGYLPLARKPLGIFPRGRLGLIPRLLFPRYREANLRDWRAYFQSTLSHNTVSFEGRNQDGYGYDAEKGQPVSRETPVLQGPLVFLEAKAGREGKVRHRRRIFGVLPRLWIVVDELEGPEAGRWIASHHFGPDVACVRKEGGVVARFPGGSGAMLGWASLEGVDLRMEIEEDWVSPLYNLREKSLTARIRIGPSKSALLLTFISLLPEAANPPEAGLVIGRTEGLFTLDLPGGGGRILVNPANRAFRREGIESDAGLCLIPASEGPGAGFLDGTHLRLSGRDYRAADGGRAAFDAT